MIVDAHMHIGTWRHADFLGRRCVVDDALEVMRVANVGGAAFVPTDMCDNEGLLASMRGALRGGYRGSLWFVPWVLPGLSAAADLQWIRDNASAVAGIKIHPSLSRTRVTDDSFRAALELAEELELVVLVHCGRWQEIASYKFAIEAARRCPRARFLLAHAGGDTPPNATHAADMVAELGVHNVWFEFSGLREYWVIERNVAKLGAERYLMGSDYCLAHPLMYIGAVQAMALPERDKQLILGENAEQLYGAALAG